MPLLAALALLALGLALPLLVPLSLVLRYRAGTARRRARGWIAALNLTAFCASAAFFLMGAGLTSLWVPDALRFSVLGVLAGVVLGIVGLWMSRWERGEDGLHYTPNRWLVLAITAVVAARIAWGLWRSAQAWGRTPDASAWLAASGVAGSMAVGGMVIGYYLAYWAGVWQRFRRHRREEAPGSRTALER